MNNFEYNKITMLLLLLSHRDNYRIIKNHNFLIRVRS